MSRAVLSPRAQKDLDGIWDYTVEQWNEDQAQRYVRNIWKAIETLAKSPRRGLACDNIRPGYRRQSIGEHIVFYRIIESGIDVVRILHQRMDYEQQL